MPSPAAESPNVLRLGKKSRLGQYLQRSAEVGPPTAGLRWPLVARHPVLDLLRQIVSPPRRISAADAQDGGEGAIYIFLKNNKKFIE